MYTKHFGLNEKPFSITPDPRYLFMSARHTEGLAHLVYGVKDSSGFIQLTGEVGTGKTMLVRTLLLRIPDGVDVALVLNPQLSGVEFLTAICEELDIALPEDRSSSKGLVDALNRHLLAAHAEGLRTILLIDEAQNLSTEVLEQIRLLTNLETAKQKLLQIILIAQPELREKLSQTNLRQLAQRVTGRYHLEPLSKDDTMRYIDHRLKVAGGLGDIFEERAKREVYRFSKGVPRLINVVSDRAMLVTYSLVAGKVTPQIVRKAAAEVSGEAMSDPKRSWLLAGVGLLTAAVIVAGIWAIGRNPGTPSTGTVAIPPQEVEQQVTTLDETVPVASVEESTLDSLLQNSASLTSGSAAMASLLAIWNIDSTGSARADCVQATANGLSCLVQRGSWSMLRHLDRPVVLTLTDSAGQAHQLVVVAMREDSADLLFGVQTKIFSAEEISNLWFGQYLLIWRPPNGDPTMLRPGDRNPKIRWLRQSLAALDPEPEANISDSDVFDSRLRQRLIEFQRQNRLEADGLAGQQTQIIINSQLGLDNTPRLSGT